jgi:hypothetical protein
MRRRLITLVAAGAVLAGCSAPLPIPQPDAEPALVPPALSTEQVSDILEEIAAVLETADGELSADDLEERVFGPALVIRSAEYVLADDGKEDALTEIPPAAQTVVVPTMEDWPRTLMLVTESPQDLQAPLVLTLVQTEPRSQYRLWGWVRLFAGVQMPATTRPELGSSLVEEDATELAAPPTDVVERYVDVLTNADASEFAEDFVPDELRPGITRTFEAWKSVVGRNGKISQTYSVGEDGPYAISTADGGALVMGVAETTTTIELSDSTLTIGDETTALAGTRTVRKKLTLSWQSVLLFWVPPEGSAQPIEVLGAEHRVVGAEAT